MARAAAKRRPPARRPDPKRRHKDPGGQRYEDTLFFNRLRTHAKWVFVLLIVVFGLGFVLFGVGSSSLGLGDILNGVGGGGSSGPSVSKALKATEKNPKDAQAWNDLASAYDLQGDYASAIPAWVKFTQLRPKNIDGFTRLATDYDQQFTLQSQLAQSAQSAAQSSPQTDFGPPSSSALGRALGSLSNPINTSTPSSDAGQQFTDALQAMQGTAALRLGAYQRLAKLQPSESGAQLQLGQAAIDAGNTAVAIGAYKQFLKLAPDDPSAPQARAQIKALEKQQG